MQGGIIAVTLTGCGTQATTTSVGPPTEVEMVHAMEDHYTLAIDAHDAVIRGDIPRFRRDLLLLSRTELPASAPGAWRPLHQALQQTATRTAEAPDVATAAAGMGEVGQACGLCHTGVGRGPTYPAPAAPDGETLSEGMQTHQWATERLWEGLTGPWDHAWERGTTALATTRVLPDDAPEEHKAREAALRAAGEAARAATTLPDRARTYGAVLATCAGCHLDGASPPGREPPPAP